MEDLKRVYVTQDDEKQWYVLPYELKYDFVTELDMNFLLESNFEEKFSKYRIGGDINLIELYARI